MVRIDRSHPRVGVGCGMSPRAGDARWSGGLLMRPPPMCPQQKDQLKKKKDPVAGSGPVPLKKVPSLRGSHTLGLHAGGSFTKAPSPRALPRPPARWTSNPELQKSSESARPPMAPPPVAPPPAVDAAPPPLALQNSESVVKQLQGNLLYALIQPEQPELAGKITGMLLELSTDEVRCRGTAVDAVDAAAAAAAAAVAHSAYGARAQERSVGKSLRTLRRPPPHTFADRSGAGRPDAAEGDGGGGDRRVAGGGRPAGAEWRRRRAQRAREPERRCGCRELEHRRGAYVVHDVDPDVAARELQPVQQLQHSGHGAEVSGERSRGDSAWLAIGELCDAGRREGVCTTAGPEQAEAWRGTPGGAAQSLCACGPFGHGARAGTRWYVRRRGRLPPPVRVGAGCRCASPWSRGWVVDVGPGRGWVVDVGHGIGRCGASWHVVAICGPTPMWVVLVAHASAGPCMRENRDDVMLMSATSYRIPDLHSARGQARAALLSETGCVTVRRACRRGAGGSSVGLYGDCTRLCDVERGSIVHTQVTAQHPAITKSFYEILYSIRLGSALRTHMTQLTSDKSVPQTGCSSRTECPVSRFGM